MTPLDGASVLGEGLEPRTVILGDSNRDSTCLACVHIRDDPRLAFVRTRNHLTAVTVCELCFVTHSLILSAISVPHFCLMSQQQR